MPESREDSVYLAKLAEQAERYEGAWHLLIDSAWLTSFISSRDG
jgi:hypothetical protein